MVMRVNLASLREVGASDSSVVRKKSNQKSEVESVKKILRKVWKISGEIIDWVVLAMAMAFITLMFPLVVLFIAVVVLMMAGIQWVDDYLKKE